MSTSNYDFGLIGLGVMGRNFILNVADHGFSAMGLDKDEEKVSSLKKEGSEHTVDATTSMEEFVNKLSKPRKIMMLVPAGKPVDSVIEELLNYVDEGDLIIDGGNSFFEDTDRRESYLKSKGVYFFGAGVSGGAKGARLGPSIMPGGDKDAYEIIKPIFEAVSAKVNGDPCVDYMGNRSAGNYVKMVHNGIEYAMMQMITEVYQVLKEGMGFNNEQLQKTFEEWDNGRLNSFLVEITSMIFGVKDPQSGNDLVDYILDKAKQKGTGKWTSQNAMDIGMPVPSIDSAVTMRAVSSFKALREKLDDGKSFETSTSLDLSDVEGTLYFAFVVAYAQGMEQLKAASVEYNYDLNLATISKIWRGGCIIRSAILEKMKSAYDKDQSIDHLFLDSVLSKELYSTSDQTRSFITFAVQKGIPVPAIGSSLAYYDAMHTGRLPLNLLQAQRDFFGSHTYERVDMDGIFHTEWEE